MKKKNGVGKQNHTPVTSSLEDTHLTTRRQQMRQDILNKIIKEHTDRRATLLFWSFWTIQSKIQFQNGPEWISEVTRKMAGFFWPIQNPKKSKNEKTSRVILMTSMVADFWPIFGFRPVQWNPMESNSGQ